MGLSPRVRGNRDDGAARFVQQGSIPACAGEPDSATMAQWTPWVYPRVCGGTMISVSWTTLVGGLSPRVRGNLMTNSPVQLCGGTLFAHPRRRIVPGLSPRVRGNHHHT